METITDYLKKYGKYTFLEKEFNEVDNTILSILAYIDFTDIVPEIDCGSITIKEASNLFYKLHNKKEIKKNIIAIRAAENILKDIANTNRFGNLELLNYENQVSFETQFGAICIKLPNKTMYVAYEGTDANLSGWKEDFMMSYDFPIRAQELAVEYLNMVSSIFGPKLYVGGHSKGGNLALVASMYCKSRVFRKIKKVYNNDGPGLREKEFNSNRYRRVALNKYMHIIPSESFFGLLYTNDDNFTVIKSTKKKLFQHDATTWVVENDHFKKDKLSNFSIRARKTMNAWLDGLNDKEKKEFTNTLFSIFKKAEINDLLEIKASIIPNMIRILKETKNISRENRKFLSITFKKLYQEWKS